MRLMLRALMPPRVVILLGGEQRERLLGTSMSQLSVAVAMPKRLLLLGLGASLVAASLVEQQLQASLSLL